MNLGHLTSLFDILILKKVIIIKYKKITLNLIFKFNLKLIYSNIKNNKVKWILLDTTLSMLCASKIESTYVGTISLQFKL